LALIHASLLLAREATMTRVDVGRCSSSGRRSTSARLRNVSSRGKYSFLLPELLAGLRALRNPEDDDGD